MTERKRCVVDASILLDFDAADIFGALFSLPLDLFTPNIVAVEVSRTYSDGDLEGFGLTIVDLDEEQILAIQAIQADNPGLSIGDISLFIVARDGGMMLLSGDGLLKQFIVSHSMECHGTLWLLEELVRLEILSKTEAIRALGTMLTKKRWLPREECAKSVKRWAEDGAAFLT